MKTDRISFVNNFSCQVCISLLLIQIKLEFFSSSVFYMEKKKRKLKTKHKSIFQLDATKKFAR